MRKPSTFSVAKTSFSLGFSCNSLRLSMNRLVAMLYMIDEFNRCDKMWAPDDSEICWTGFARIAPAHL